MEQETFLEKVKKILEYIVAPLVAIGGFITYLLLQNKGLRQENASANASVEAAKTEAKIEVDSEKSKEASDDYDAVRKQYLSEHPDKRK